MSYPHRCKQCRARKALKRRIDNYIRPPKCSCGSREFYFDSYRFNSGTKDRSGKHGLCYCDSYMYPHSKASKLCRYSEEVLIDIALNGNNDLITIGSVEPCF